MSRRTAAEWFMKLQDPDLPAEELLAWENWIERSPQNKRVFDDVVRLSRRTDVLRNELADIPIPFGSELADDNYEGSETIAEWIRQTAGDVTHQENLASTKQGQWMRNLAMAAGVAAVAVGISFLIRGDFFGSAALDQFQSYQTAESEHRDVSLADGTDITIGARSSVLVNYSRDRRAVVLEQGEALFTVAKDTSRPFIVIAGSGTITAVGTSFNVRRDEDRVVVTVTEGKVLINRRATESAAINALNHKPVASTQPTSATLTVGHQGVYDASEINIVKVSDPTAATAWRAGRLQYRAEPLMYVVTGVNRYYSKEIIIADKNVEELLFTGSVFRGQAEEWLEGLEEVFPIDVIDMGDNKILLQQRELQ